MAIDHNHQITIQGRAKTKSLDPSRANKFDELVLALKEALGPSSGLTPEDVDVAHLMQLMEEYTTSESDWSQFAMADASRGYTRNLVDEGNGKSNLVGLTTPRHHYPAQSTRLT